MAIAATVENTNHVFKDILNRLQSLQDDQPHGIGSSTVADARDRFKLWVGNIGASHRPASKLSLESRLVHANELLQGISDLLDDLGESLNDALEIVRGQQENRNIPFLQIDEDGNDISDNDLETKIVYQSGERSECQALFEDINECISSLFRVSVLISRATPRDRFSKAQDDQQIIYLDQFDVNYVQERYEKLSRPEYAWLRNRLGRANTKRRRFLQYCLQHRSQLAGDSSQAVRDKLPDIPPSKNSERRALDEEHLPASSTAQPRNKFFDFVSETMATRPSTKASTLDIDMLQESGETIDEDDDTRSYTSVATSAHAEAEKFLELPQLSEVNDDGKSTTFECPFCRTMKRFTKERSWQRHVYEDLRAYVCTVGGSECDNELFGDRKSWFDHESQCHRSQWSCVICNKGQFSTTSKLREHFNVHHAQRGPELDDLLLAAGQCPLQSIPAWDCPFCDRWANSMRSDYSSNSEVMDDVPMVEAKLFSQHVASHMQQLALFSIPRASGDGKGDGTTGSASHDAIQFSQSSRSDPTVEAVTTEGSLSAPSSSHEGAMDSLRIVTNAITLVDFSVKIHSLVSRWREAPEYLRKLEETIRNMESVLKLVKRTLNSVSPTSLDHGDKEIILSITKSYTELVDELDNILRQSDTTGTPLDRLSRSLAKMMKERDIDNKISKIQFDMLQLTLVHTSLTWRELAEFKAAADDFNRLLPDMAAPAYTGPSEDFTTPATPMKELSEELFDLLFQEAPMETNEPRRPSVLDGIYALEREKLEYKVKYLTEKRMFSKAAQVQKEIVEMVESQVDIQLDSDIGDLQEQQADLLLRCYTPVRHNEAAKILFYILRRLRERAATEMSLKHQARLMSKLAKLFRDEDGLGVSHDPGKSKIFFRSSMDSLSRMNPFPAEEFLAVGAAMVGFHEANSEFDQAKELETRILRLMRQHCPDLQFDWRNYKNDSERSVLQWCRQHGFRANELSFHFDVVHPLFNHLDTSPLHLAIQRGDKDMTEKMLVEVEAIDVMDNDGMTPLMLATQTRRSDIAQLLLEYNASTDLLTRDGRTCLHLCLEGDSQKGVKVTILLLESDSGLKDRVDRKGRTALHLAVSKGHKRICKTLLERQADPNKQEESGKTALLMAIESHDLDHRRSQTSLARVSPSSSIYSTHATPVSPVPRPDPKFSIIQLLLDNGANPTISDYTDNLPLHSACRQNDIETVRLLLQYRDRYGTDLVNQRGPVRTTPVIIAVKNQDVAVVRELIRCGANPSLTDSTGQSAMDYARLRGTWRNELLGALRGA